MYAKFGSEVTLLDSGKSFLPGEDADIAEAIYNAMTAKNIGLVTGAAVEGIRNSPDGVIVQSKDFGGASKEIKGSAVRFMGSIIGSIIESRTLKDLT